MVKKISATATKKVTKKAAPKKSPAKKTSPKKITKRVTPAKKSSTTTKKTAPAKKATKKTTPATGSFAIEQIAKGIDPTVKFTSDAIEILEAMLTEKFEQIATQAVKIVQRGKKENLGCDDVKKAVDQVFKEKFSKK